MRLIANWKELETYIKTDPNPNYTIEFDADEDGPYSGWIKPKMETQETSDNYWKHHIYLSTHTFYGKNKDGTSVDSYKHSTKILQDFGFNIELQNWDK